MALPRGAMGLPAVCNCGISRSYSLTIFVFDLKHSLNLRIIICIFQRSHSVEFQKYMHCATVNSETFTRALFSRNFAYAKFRENKTLEK